MKQLKLRKIISLYLIFGLLFSQQVFAIDLLKKTLKIVNNAIVKPVEKAVKATENIAGDVIHATGKAVGAVGNVGEAVVDVVQGDSTKGALKRAEENVKEGAKSIDSAVDKTVQTGIDIVVKAPINAATITADEILHTNGKISKEVLIAQKKIGTALEVTSQPKNLGKIAIIYVASSVMGPYGAAMAYVLYDKLVLKKSMTEKEMLKSFVIGAAAGYASNSIAGMTEGNSAIDASKSATYFSHASSTITKNLVTDFGGVVLNKNDYEFKKFLKSVANGAVSVEIGNDFATTVAEATINSGLNSASDQLIENNLKNIDLKKVTNDMISGFAEGITREAIHNMLEETLIKWIPEGAKRIDQKAFLELKEFLYITFQSEENSIKESIKNEIVKKFLNLPKELQSDLLLQLSLNIESAKNAAAQLYYNKNYNELNSNEKSNQNFNQKLKLLIEETEKNEADFYGNYSKIINKLKTTRDPSGALKLATTGTSLTLIEGGLKTAGNLSSKFFTYSILLEALFISEDIGTGSDVVPSSAPKEILNPVMPPLDINDLEGNTLYHQAKTGDKQAIKKYNDYLKNTSEENTSQNSKYKIDWNKQGKHNPSHNNYDPELNRSIITVSNQRLEFLVNLYKNFAEPISGTYGKAGYRERIDLKEIIGIYKNQNGSISEETTIVTIHHSNSGVHIVPGRMK